MTPTTIIIFLLLLTLSQAEEQVTQEVAPDNNPNACFFDLIDDNGISVSYNLSKFHLPEEGNKIFEVDDSDNTGWKYEFNI